MNGKEAALLSHPAEAPLFQGKPPQIFSQAWCTVSASDIVTSNSNSFQGLLLRAHPASQVLGYTVQA